MLVANCVEMHESCEKTTLTPLGLLVFFLFACACALISGVRTIWREEIERRGANVTFLGSVDPVRCKMANLRAHHSIDVDANDTYYHAYMTTISIAFRWSADHGL